MVHYISQPAQVLRAARAAIGKTGVIYPAAFLMSSTLGLLNLGIVFFAREAFQASPRTVGWLAAVWSMTYVAGCATLRPLLARLLPRHLVLFSITVIASLLWQMQAATRLSTVFVLYGLHGFVLSLFWPPLMGWLSADEEGQSLNRIVAGFNLSWCAGAVISPYACGWLSERSVRLPLQVGFGLLVLALALVMAAIAFLPRLRLGAAPVPGEKTAALQGRQTALRFPSWLGLFAAYLGLGVLLAVFPMACEDELRFPRRLIGGLFLLRGLFNAVGFIALGRWGFWHFKPWPVAVAPAVAGVAFMALSGNQSPVWIGALLVAFGLGMAMSYTASIFHGVSGSLNRAGRMAVHEATLAAGLVLGSAAGGILYQRFGSARVYGVCAAALLVLAALCAGLSAWARLRDQRQESPQAG